MEEDMNNEVYKLINEAYFKEKKTKRFLSVLKPVVEDLDIGRAKISMVVETNHLNLHDIVHGGVLASLADLTMGIACISCMKKVVTTDMSISYIGNVSVGEKISALAKVVQNGKRMMCTNCEIYDERGKILVQAIASFYVLDDLKEEDIKKLVEENE